ncbi:COP9 signalosome complex subunit 3, partial [Tremellales sp. Uapishka_1]
MPAAHAAFPQFPLPVDVRPPLPSTSAEIHNLIQKYDSNDDVHHSLVPLLEDIVRGKKEDLLALPDDDLNTLSDNEISRKTAALVYVLSARMNKTRRTPSMYNVELIQLAVRLCEKGNLDQFKSCAYRLSKFAWGLLRLTQYVQKQPELAIFPLQCLVTRIMFSDTISGVHAALFEACLLSRQYESVLRILDETHLDVHFTYPDYLDVLTFHHHAGLICAALKRFDRAQEFFKTAVSVPTQTASAIQIACAQRAVLCGLLHSGKNLTWPKYTSSIVTRALDKHLADYTKLAKAFENGDWDAVKTAALAAQFKTDGNSGLVRQVLRSVTTRKILKIQESYSRIRVSDLVAKVGLKGQQGMHEVLDVVEQMINAGIIHASITGKSDAPVTWDPIITFLEDPSDYALDIPRDAAHAEQLFSHLTRLDREKSMNEKWLKQQANTLLLSGTKGKSNRADDFDSMMMAEEFMVDRHAGRMKVGADLGDVGF